ncbi:MAG: ABC transporter permease subunit [Oscillospiraceae bacterium]|nr:ABC transporter permease subunit [Oscillospiraceae bacterium]
MKRLTDLEYLKLNKFQKILYKLKLFFCAIPLWFVGLGSKILKFFKSCWTGIKDEFVSYFTTFTKGNWAVKTSFFIFGFGNFFYGQIARGILFLLFEVIFIVYMCLPSGGAYWLGKCNWFQHGATVGTVGPVEEYNAIYDSYTTVYGDDSVKVLLYGLLTVVFIFAFFVTWRMQIKQCRTNMDIVASGRKIKSGKDDLRSMVDDQFHKTLLALPLGGIIIFTIIPIIYMVIIAFTSYDAAHDGYSNLFTWVGWEHFNELTNFGNGGLGLAFGEILGWTLMWAFFATFTNFFLGMFVAIMINKKGIKIKKFWRTILVMTIAIPQFVSLLYVSKLFDSSGILGKLFLEWGLIPDSMIAKNQLSFWQNPTSARILVIILNIWVGIPYIMLQATGILMNIPSDLYESAKIDGASGFQQYTKITLPYMMFVMGPYLLTSFVGNLNNFNVIYLLTGGNPINTEIGTAGGVSVGSTDLLITWLYKMTLNSAESKYYMASVIGILVFVVVAALSLIVYNVIPSTKNEEDYS